jgi:hypothetical protein
MVFRSDVWALLAAAAVAAVAGVVGLWVLLTVIVGKDMAWQGLVETASAAAVGALIGTAAGIWRRRGRPVWIRISSAGIEMAPQGQAVLISWDNIVTARVRRRGLLAAVDVVPADLDAVRAASAGRDLPRVRHLAGRTALSMGVGLLRPGPAALRAELRRRLPQPDGSLRSHGRLPPD